MSASEQSRVTEDQVSPEEAAERRARFDAAMVGSRDELFNYVRRRTRDPDIAADLTQETISRMMVYRDAANIESYTLLMYRVVHNLMLELQRARQRHHASQHIPLSVAGPISTGEPPLEDITDARNSLDLILKSTLLDLPPKCRLAFTLSRFDGLTYPQVAAKMGISVKMVEKHISRALSACRAAVKDRMP